MLSFLDIKIEYLYVKFSNNLYVLNISSNIELIISIEKIVFYRLDKFY
jgi:hypothetical protein